jgi:hypothetical protein
VRSQQASHNDLQARVFGDPEMVREFKAPLPPEIEEVRLSPEHINTK